MNGWSNIDKSYNDSRLCSVQAGSMDMNMNMNMNTTTTNSNDNENENEDEDEIQNNVIHKVDVHLSIACEQFYNYRNDDEDNDDDTNEDESNNNPVE